MLALSACASPEFFVAVNRAVPQSTLSGEGELRPPPSNTNGEVFEAVDQGQRGLVGQIFDVSDYPLNHSDWNGSGSSRARLDNFNLPSRPSLEHDIVVPDLNIPNRAFDSGFPGQTDLIEWFAIRFEGQIYASVAGTYEFRLSSDDGSRLYIDNVLVVNNDGVHAVASADGSRTLAAGWHPIRLEYFQGPRMHIALQFFWRQPGAVGFAIVPADKLDRP